MGAEMEIPDEVWDAVVKAAPLKDVISAKGSAWDINELQERAVVSAAPLIVAAELERLAAKLEVAIEGTHGGLYDGYSAAISLLERRASELRGERQ